jgi:hypothetical protein
MTIMSMLSRYCLSTIGVISVYSFAKPHTVTDQDTVYELTVTPITVMS